MTVKGATQSKATAVLLDCEMNGSTPLLSRCWLFAAHEFVRNFARNAA